MYVFKKRNVREYVAKITNGGIYSTRQLAFAKKYQRKPKSIEWLPLFGYELLTIEEAEAYEKTVRPY